MSRYQLLLFFDGLSLSTRFFFFGLPFRSADLLTPPPNTRHHHPHRGHGHGTTASYRADVVKQSRLDQSCTRPPGLPFTCSNLIKELDCIHTISGLTGFPTHAKRASCKNFAWLSHATHEQQGLDGSTFTRNRRWAMSVQLRLLALLHTL